MRILPLLITMLPIGAPQPEVIRFDQATPGKLPSGWSIAMTHAGSPPQWEIVHDESASSSRMCWRNYLEIERPADFR
jgi:hypothetical protein